MASPTRFHPLSFILLWLASACMLTAQAATPASIPLRLRLLAFQPGQATEQAFLHDPAAPPATAGTKAPVKSYLNHEFTPVSATSPKLILTKSADSASLAQPDEWLAEITLPAGVKSAVLMCLPEATGAKFPFRVLVMDDSKKAFPPGSFRVTNLSPSQVRIELEKRPWLIKPGATEIIIDPPVRHGNLSGMKTFVQEGQNWRRIASGIWPHPGKERVIQLLFYHPVAKQVQLRAFDDIPPRETSAPPEE
jgi:hypothetical protein